ncbi:hypothetical protein [Thermithiobacillus plumbiphilus]|uniref:Uncharacterized protein n=1 Tax=Thermithiobacillus plumbiphilus TaxID=1729899 RepID=A0ABU9DB72_9PROT
MATKRILSAKTLYIIALAIFVVWATLNYFWNPFRQGDVTETQKAAMRANFERAVQVVRSDLARVQQGGATHPDIVAYLNQIYPEGSPLNPEHPAFIVLNANVTEPQDDGQTMISPGNVLDAYRKGQPVTVTPAPALQKLEAGISYTSIETKAGGGAGPIEQPQQ